MSTKNTTKTTKNTANDFPFEIYEISGEVEETTQEVTEEVTETTKEESKKTRNYNVKVTSARLVKGKKIIFFNAFVNDIFCSGLSFIWGEKDGKPYEFISFPSQKYTNAEGSVSYSKYYSFAVSNELLNDIKSQLQTIITKK